MSESLNRQVDRLQKILRSDLDPDGRAFVPLADAHRQLGNMDQALALVREGLEEHPDFASAHVVEGWIHREQGDIDTALKSFERVVELDPENAIARLAVAELIDDVRARTYREKIEAREQGALATERPVVPVASLAPDERPVVPVASLAPDDAPEVADVATPASTPDERPVVPVASLAPDDVAEVADVATPASTPDERPVVPVASLAPDDVAEVADVATPAPTPAVEPAVAEEPSPDGPPAEGDIFKIYTRTLAELYAGQGGVDRAIEVYRKLLSDDPENSELAKRLTELEAGESGQRPVVGVESLAPDSAHGEGSTAAHRMVVPIGLLAPDDAPMDEVSTHPA